SKSLDALYPAKLPGCARWTAGAAVPTWVFLRPSFMQVFCRWCDLDQRMNRRRRLFQHSQSFVIAVSGEQSCFDCGQESAERAEGGVHRGGFVAAVDHAIGAGGIAGLRAVVAPIRCFK